MLKEEYGKELRYYFLFYYILFDLRFIYIVNEDRDNVLFDGIRVLVLFVGFNLWVFVFEEV